MTDISASVQTDSYLSARVNLPTAEERKAIFDVHLKKKGYGNLEPSEKLIKHTDGFNGADIEAVVNEAMEEVFIEQKNLNMETLEKIALRTISISKSCNRQIEDMKKVFAESNFKDATTGNISVKL